MSCERGKGRVNPPPRKVLETSTGSTDFRVHLGSLLGVILETFLRFFCDWDGQMGDGFQVHVSDGPEVEMLLESGGCTCYNHGKNNGV